MGLNEEHSCVIRRRRCLVFLNVSRPIGRSRGASADNLCKVLAGLSLLFHLILQLEPAIRPCLGLDASYEQGGRPVHKPYVIPQAPSCTSAFIAH